MMLRQLTARGATVLCPALRLRHQQAGNLKLLLRRLPQGAGRAMRTMRPRQSRRRRRISGGERRRGGRGRVLAEGGGEGGQMPE